MFSQSADLYDLIYRNFKDYETEADLLAVRIRSLRPGARRLLDVACGTGEHALHLGRRGFVVDGVDIEPGFVELSGEKNRGGEGRFVQGDMTALDLGARYDVVLCLFSSIGYALTVENLDRTIAGFARHLNPGGLALVEPWFGPEQMSTGKVYLKTAETEGFSVCRMSHTEIAGRVSRLQFEYIIGDSEGLRRRSEHHELGLFTRGEMERAFQDAGFRVELDEEGIYDRGLYVGQLEPARAPF
jgi:SAM-dependent methyltransferase